VLATHGVVLSDNRQTGLSLPGSDILPRSVFAGGRRNLRGGRPHRRGPLARSSTRGTGRAWHPGAVLTEMRDRRGGPNRLMRAVALLLALLLAGPLTVLLLTGLVRVVSAAF